MPDGTGSLQDLPVRARDAGAYDEAADSVYCKAIDRVTAASGKQNQAQTKLLCCILLSILSDFNASQPE